MCALNMNWLMETDKLKIAQTGYCSWFGRFLLFILSANIYRFDTLLVLQ